jgi:pilus assembly protein CpaF
MFSIIISEKGGAERRESFDKNEINVGRVQGNDLMLPKGNVSKHHARLLYRDGRFIVTDLKSTNGTYVNGRKIAQATIVREGDKIYIGDFVLRLDSAAGATGDQPQQNDDESVRTLARNQPPQPAAAAQQAPSLPAALAAPVARPSYQDPPEEPEPAPPAPPPPQPPPPAQTAPRASQAGQQPARGVQATKGQTMPLGQNNARAATSPSAGAMPNRSPSAIGTSAPIGSAASAAAAASAPAQPPVVMPAPPPRGVPRETSAQAGRRLALITLVDRIADAVDLAALKSSPTVEDALSQTIERAARQQAQSMREEGEAPEGTDLDQLVRDALRELVGLGPIGPLLEDDEVSEIHCLRNDQVASMRGGQIVLADASFTSDESVSRAIARLALQSGEALRDGETMVERRLPRGAHLVAVLPPTAAVHAFVVRKRRRADATLEDLVRAGSLSRPMAVFLDACVQARANLLVCAPSSATTAAFVAAIASAAPAGERMAVAHDGEEVSVGQAHALSLSMTVSRDGEAVRAAARLRPDRLFVAGADAHAAAATLEAIAEGIEGLCYASSAPSLRHGLARLASQIAIARPGLGVDAARECIADSFDAAIELAPAADGRPRITRIAELGGTDGKLIVARDLFTFTPDPQGEGSFVATGVTPRAVADFAARGVRLDGAIFKRTVGR